MPQEEGGLFSPPATREPVATPVVAEEIKTVLLITNQDVESSIQAFLDADKREVNVLRVKLLGGGAGKFDIAEEVSTEFDAVVLDSHSINTLWKSRDDPFPVCYSMDGINVHPQAVEPQAENCAVCPHGGFKGECKQGMRLYLLTTDRVLPLYMNLPVTSVSPWKNYKTGLMYKNIFAHTVLTRFIAGPYKTRGGNMVTRVGERMISVLSKKDIERINWYRERTLPKLSQRTIDVEESTDFVGPLETQSENI